ncbi:MAG: hypothetical protein GEV03_16970 [Streptosporangiales bacterium]|nr:hypothetical protein [Streptosporangiales bacterium]
MIGLASALPRDLIPGDPAAAEDLAGVLRQYAAGAAENAQQLRGLGDGRWTGDAADAFRARLAELPDKLERGVDAFLSASTALQSYADALRGGQAQAEHAIELARQAEREHALWLRQVDAYNQAVRAGGDPGARPPEVSPGAPTMAEAEALAERAQASVDDVAGKTAAVLNEEAAAAPDTRSFVGDNIRAYWEGTKRYWSGFAEASAELGEFGFKLTPTYALIDPEGFATNLAGIGQGLVWGAQHPVAFAKAAVDWQTWATDPARAFGRLGPDALLTAATAGTGAAGAGAVRGATAARHAAKAADDAAEIADDAKDAARTAERLSPDQSPRLLDRPEAPPPHTAADGPDFRAISRDPEFDGETEGLSRELPPGHRVEYLDEAAREEYRLFVHDGRLYGVDGRPFDTSEGKSIFGRGDRRAIFVMDRYGNIYASNNHQLGRFHHSSFLAGEPVAGAGEMRVVNGRLEYISDRSGHYKPTPEYLEQVVERLRRDGINFDDVEFGSWD